jgi:hypothetical protein
MVNTTLTTSPNGARAEEGRDVESPLDRSRAKAKHAQQALAEAGRRVNDIDERLERNTAQTSADEKAVAAARDEVKRLKKALKDGEKERQKLVLARKRAIADVEKAEDKARKAEAKYDREVLADLIEREKENDRATSAAASATPVGPAAPGRGARGRAAPGPGARGPAAPGRAARGPAAPGRAAPGTETTSPWAAPTSNAGSARRSSRWRH